MKKVFIDTNVVLDFVLHREHCADVKAVVAWLVEKQVPMIISVGGFYTMHYVIDKYLRKTFYLDRIGRDKPLRTLLTRILQTFVVAEHDNNSLLRGVSSPDYVDLEDSCQFQLALRSGCDILVTLNAKDFRQTDGILIVTPQQFKERYVTN